MAVGIEDVLQTNLILVGVNLINSEAELDGFRRGVGVEIVTAEASLGGELVERTHDLSRDRIKIRVTPERVAISREYPDEADIERLASVVWQAIENTDLSGQEVRALGYNVELVYETGSQEPASQYLSDHLFTPFLLRDEESQLVGGAARLQYTKEGRTWQARFEPRFNDGSTTKIFAGLNLHEANPDLSSLGESDIRDSLELVWSEIRRLIVQIDGSDM